MSIDKLINILVTITRIKMMISIELGITFARVIAVARNWRTVTLAGLANYICVPAVAVGLLVAFHAHPMVAAGVLIISVCPGAPGQGDLGGRCFAVGSGARGQAVDPANPFPDSGVQCVGGGV